jgi:nucleotide-binding universal stress UspA family protein
VQARTASATVRHGYPPACLASTAAEIGASLVALGTKGKSRLEAGLLGSVSEQFVTATSHDVLLAKPDRVDVARPQRAANDSVMRVG